MRPLVWLRSTLTLVLAGNLAVILVVGCGGGESDSGAAAVEELAEPPGVDLGPVVTEQDVATVRQHYDAGRSLWDASDLDTYRLEVSLQTVATLRMEVVDGEVVAEESTAVDGNRSEVESLGLPRSIDAVFELVADQLAVFEDDASLVPEPGECGRHLNVSFDPSFGYPTYFDGLGPCDDGVGIVVSISLD